MGSPGSPKAGLHPLIRKYTAPFRAGLAETYTRDLHKWLIVAPIIGIVTGLLIVVLTKVLLDWLWPPVLIYYSSHHWVIVPGLAGGFLVAGLIMQWLTPNPDEHSTEEIIQSYHERQGAIHMRPFFAKLAAAVATVGAGGSAALEGPSIYGGGALGSWIWGRLQRFRAFRLDPRDRRIMLICGAAAGMAAVFRAPLTGIVFALEMPYKDDLAHEALLPSLISSVVSYVTLAAILGAQPLFDFAGSGGSFVFSRSTLLWCALLGVICGLVAMVFTTTFRRFREFMVHLTWPHWLKMVAGGLLTGLCGLLFVLFFSGDHVAAGEHLVNLMPIGPNYEAVNGILQHAHGSFELTVFGIFKLVATLFSLGVGGVSAMFVPLFLSGGSFGIAFAQTIVHSPVVQLYAAVGMAAFIAAGYKTPLTAVVFVAEAAGGHAFIIPALIGAAVAYAVSGEASASGDQRLHEGVKVSDLHSVRVSEIMESRVTSVDAAATLQDFMSSVAGDRLHTVYPVCADGRPIGLVSIRAVLNTPMAEWATTTFRQVMTPKVTTVPPSCDATEALRLLVTSGHHVLIIAEPSGPIRGVVTSSNILAAFELRREERSEREVEASMITPAVEPSSGQASGGESG